MLSFISSQSCLFSWPRTVQLSIAQGSLYVTTQCVWAGQYTYNICYICCIACSICYAVTYIFIDFYGLFRTVFLLTFLLLCNFRGVRGFEIWWLAESELLWNKHYFLCFLQNDRFGCGFTRGGTELIRMKDFYFSCCVTGKAVLYFNSVQ